MEWVLQVVDEIDDAVAIVRHAWIGAQSQMAVMVSATVGAAAAWTVGMTIRRSKRWARAA